MTTTKPFPTLAVLSAITGKLVTKDFGDVHAVLEFMAGGPVWTHQLPRVGREAQPVILEARPDLAVAIKEAEEVTPENWQTFADIWSTRYGAEIAVPRMTAEQHVDKGPLDELAEMMPDKPIVVVETGRRE